MTDRVEEVLNNMRSANFAIGDAICRALNLPPSPVMAHRLPALDDSAAVAVMHRHWSQSFPKWEALALPRDVTPEQQKSLAITDIAQHVAQAANPLRELAAALTAIADDCDVHLVIPVGIALLSRHESPIERRNPKGRSQHAEVEISVTTVSSEWLREQIGERVSDVRDQR